MVKVILDSGIYSRIVAMLAEHTRRFGIALRLRNHCLPQCSRYRFGSTKRQHQYASAKRRRRVYTLRASLVHGYQVTHLAHSDSRSPLPYRPDPLIDLHNLYCC